MPTLPRVATLGSVRQRRAATAVVVVLGLAGTGLAAASGGSSATLRSCTTLQQGARGTAVATVQRLVGASADGDFGPLTAAAVRHWQQAHHVRPTGAVDAATWQALPIAVTAAACGQPVTGTKPSCTTVLLGSRTPVVAVLQRRIGVAVDADFGPRTRAAVVAAQRRAGLASNGVVASATWAALGLTGTPACVATPAASRGTSRPPLPTDGQSQLQATTVRLASQLPALAGTSASPVARRVLAFARGEAGKPYVWGAAGPSSYDCSGLVMAAYRAAGVTTPRVAADQYAAGPTVPLNRAQQGDLVFWATDLTRPDTIYHVAIYAGRGHVVDAPHTGAVVGTRRVWTSQLLPVAVRPVAQLALPARPGQTGWTVAQLQQALDRHGEHLDVDGAFGQLTAAAVRRWQDRRALPVTGVADVRTWLTL